jgi:hypothetical protein
MHYRWRLRPDRLAGYKSLQPESTEGTTVAEVHSRRRSWATVAAFGFIILVAIADGVDEGFSVWDWLIIAAGVVFIIQAVFRLRESR